MILKNKGMYLETVINNSLHALLKKGLLIQKVPINNSIINIENNVIKAKLEKNSFCDYIGIYNGIYLEFDAKETNKADFNLANIKKNQFEKLKLINNLNGIAFLIIYFHDYDSYFAVNYNQLSNFKIKKIPYEWFKNNSFELYFDNLVLDLTKYINRLINYNE
ncbi:Holliday junction resolvase RecU [Spiroplasma tabanidicola]|uniref:Holliday junction resolvase RecU n=1 Tax=Spiroplasma tabanidicola TaxID=324079 RepID=A0A6I6CI45_9MOLU|nr:Holliday junction resolvase RecU [Spiroplasma tabanidicola]QGS51723.1 Holliday junction-specific endonuclease [Spiroplasma tabanidicola]